MRICKYCGELFLSEDDSDFCCKEHERYHRYIGKVCEWCGEPIPPEEVTNMNQKYHKECREHAKREKTRQRVHKYYKRYPWKVKEMNSKNLGSYNANLGPTPCDNFEDELKAVKREKMRLLGKK